MLPQETRVPLMLIAALGCGLWIALAGRTGRLPALAPWTEAADSCRWRPTGGRLVALLIALALLVAVTLAGLDWPVRLSPDLLLLGWLAALPLLILAAAGPFRRRAAWRERRGEWLTVIGLTALALFLRVWMLGRLPVYISFDDEEAFWNMARGMAFAGDASPFATGWYQHPLLMPALAGYAIELFGNSAFAFRLPNALLGALHVPALYALARAAFGPRVARWSALALTVLISHVVLSRYGLNQSGDTLMVVLAAWFLLRALREGRLLDYALLGLCLGIAQLFYVGGLLALLILAAAGGLLLGTRRALLRRQAGGLLLAAVVFLLATLPYHAYLLHHGMPILPRYDTYVTENWGIRDYQGALAVSPALLIETVAVRLRDAYLAYIATFDTFRYGYAHLPLLGLVGICPFLLGLMLALRRWRDPRYLLPAAFLLLIPPPTLLAPPVPRYFRYVLALPFAALLTGLGVEAIRSGLGGTVGRWWRTPWLRRAGIALAILAVIGLEVGAHALTLYTPWPRLAHDDRVYSHLAADMAALDPGRIAYFVFPEDVPAYRSAVLATAVGGRFNFDRYRFVHAIAAIERPGRCAPPITVYLSAALADQVDALVDRLPGAARTAVRAGEELLYHRLVYTPPCPDGGG